MTKRKHRNKLTRLTAKERACSIILSLPRGTRFSGTYERNLGILMRALQAHAREAVARYRRKQAVKLARAWDKILGAGARITPTQRAERRARIEALAPMIRKAKR